ncbi:DEAD/DEAH box helicase [Methylobacterium oryzisoli]|uniref:DEAD/DEAH box helicase n=1 Tax=Methylobacterium oryzisoli TaxID=3385502 RepID=UPI003892962D
MILRDRAWKLKYTPDNGDLVRDLYVPLLTCAERYDRLTGYFSASALALAARGVEWLVTQGGRMRMVVGCTLDQDEVNAIEQGESLRATVAQRLQTAPLAPLNGAMAEALELLAWMVAHGHLEIRVAVPCDEHRRPLPADGLFHEKSGVVEDKTGDRIAFNGSLNETAAGWTRNWESLNVFASWRDPDRVNEEDGNFARLWANQAKHVVTLDVPAAVRDDLLRFLPADDRPARLKRIMDKETLEHEVVVVDQTPTAPDPEPQHLDPRSAVWSFIAQAATLPGGGARVGEATSAVIPWPHQVRAFHRLYDQWPPKLLVADEVGLGKTIQAGLLLRQAWLSGRAKRILVLAPKSVCRQWQIELREKFNLNWPIYDGAKLCWLPSPATRGQTEKPVSREEWHREPAVIVSSHLVRRGERQGELVEAADPYDLVILDEAHHARRKAAGGASNERRANALLGLMRRLRARTQGLVLLTATPMQVHPVEVFDLLDLLGVPPEWGEDAFLKFFEDVEHESPSHEAMDRLAGMFRAVETAWGPVTPEQVRRLDGGGNLRASRILKALRDKASTPRRMLAADERKTALRVIKGNTPVNRLVSRHTRELLRRYYKAGKITTRIADRRVRDEFIDLSPAERRLYERVEEYIATTYDQANDKERNAIGFVMTIYRRRLASSFYALGQTLTNHLQAVTKQEGAGINAQIILDEVLDDDVESDDPDAEPAAHLEQQALLVEERANIESLLADIRALPPDTKLDRLRAEIIKLRANGYAQVIVFTQFTDTMDCLRAQLVGDKLKLMCFSGRGGEVVSADGTWRTISRDEVKRRFREGQADVLLCTDAAAEGLNFQFCGALINYDMPWNPMRVEQRIGRIDRLGQKHHDIHIVNLHYANTVEADVYLALRQRIGLFENVVGRLQPILSRLPSLIQDRLLEGRARDEVDRQQVVSAIETETARVQADGGGFDINAVTESDLEEVARPEPALSLQDLDTVIRTAALMPPGVEVSALGEREYRFMQPGLDAPIRVTTSPAYYEQHAETVELWSPGCPVFPPLEPPLSSAPGEVASSLGAILATLRS